MHLHYPQQWVFQLVNLSTMPPNSNVWYHEGWTHYRLQPSPGTCTNPYLLDWGGIFPIVVPPDTDAVVGIPVAGFHRTDDYDGWPAFVWTRTAGQELYEVGYGRADQGYESHRTVTTTMPALILRDSTLDSSAVYVARCRAQSHHACAIHDTMVWSEWSDTVQFRLSRHDTHGEEGIGQADVGVATFTLSPNPARERVTVAVGSAVAAPCVVVLRDEQGRELLRQRLEGREVTLSTRGLPAGVYLVTLESPQGSSTQKLVVER